MEKQELRQAYLQREREPLQHNVQTATNTLENVKCPKCGALNDRTATFCENCGHALGQKQCPYCHAQLVPGADICEQCHRYVLDNVCSFCGASMGTDEMFCPDCGMSRDGVICPVCHTHNMFSVCMNCGTPLTESARLEVEEVRKTAVYQKMRALSKELEKLQRQTIATTEEQKARQMRCADIRNRVLALLSDDGQVPPLPDSEIKVESAETLASLILRKRGELQDLLDGMAARKLSNAALTRRYMLARRPPLSRLGWRCNFKNELHRGPQDCACPQLGGTWVVTDGKQETELKSKK